MNAPARALVLPALLALAARAQATSDGPDTGSCFTLSMPLKG